MPSRAQRFADLVQHLVLAYDRALEAGRHPQKMRSRRLAPAWIQRQHLRRLAEPVGLDSMAGAENHPVSAAIQDLL